MQVLNSCQITSPYLKIEENTELMCLLQTYKPKREDPLQEVRLYTVTFTQALAFIPKKPNRHYHQ